MKELACWVALAVLLPVVIIGLLIEQFGRELLWFTAGAALMWLAIG